MTDKKICRKSFRSTKKKNADNEKDLGEEGMMRVLEENLLAYTMR
jgi:hypothetical protein